MGLVDRTLPLDKPRLDIELVVSVLSLIFSVETFVGMPIVV